MERLLCLWLYHRYRSELHAKQNLWPSARKSFLGHHLPRALGTVPPSWIRPRKRRRVLSSVISQWWTLCGRILAGTPWVDEWNSISDQGLHGRDDEKQQEQKNKKRMPSSYPLYSCDVPLFQVQFSFLAGRAGACGMLYDVFAQIFFYTNLSIFFRFFPLLRTLISSLEFSGKLLETYDWKTTCSPGKRQSLTFQMDTWKKKVDSKDIGLSVFSKILKRYRK